MRILRVSFHTIYAWNRDDSEQQIEAQTKQNARASLVAEIVPNCQTQAGAYANYDGLIISEDQYFAFLKRGEKFAELEVVEIANDNDAFSRLAGNNARIPSPEQAFNSVTHVHVAGQVLSTYNRVELLEDACTYALQSKLDEGWRIIAACTQPDQRRPDYILGRWEPKT